MEMITNTGVLAALKMAANNTVPSIEQEYDVLCHRARYGIFERLETLGRMAPSLRFYNPREAYLRGEKKKRAIELREIWHAIWHINDSCPYCEGQVAHVTVQLSEYTTRQVLLVASFLKFSLAEDTLMASTA